MEFSALRELGMDHVDLSDGDCHFLNAVRASLCIGLGMCLCALPLIMCAVCCRSGRGCAPRARANHSLPACTRARVRVRSTYARCPAMFTVWLEVLGGGRPRLPGTDCPPPGTVPH
jgi:hypothetical protein